MNGKKIAFAERIEQNSKNYSPKDLINLEAAEQMLSLLRQSFGLDTMMTDRHGSILLTIGDFGGFKPDVVNHPGIKIRVREGQSAIFMPSMTMSRQSSLTW